MFVSQALPVEQIRSLTDLLLGSLDSTLLKRLHRADQTPPST